MKTKITLFITTAFLILFVGIYNVALSDSTGKLGNSGAPNESTCSQANCHGYGNGSGSTGGLPDNMGPGSISITCSNMPGWVYTPGMTYNFTVMVTQPTCTLFGFSCLPVNLGSAGAGSFVITDAIHTHTGTPIYSTRSYITHNGLNNPLGGMPTNSNPAIFKFNWVAPSTNVGPIKFYFDGIAANADAKENAGDNVYTGTQIATPVTPVSSPLLLSSIQSPTTLRTIATTPSNSKSFDVAGLALTGNEVISVPSPFELSFNSSSGFATTALSLTPMSGSVNTTSVYVRYNPSLPGGTTQSITISSPGATSIVKQVTGAVVTPSLGNPNPSTLTQFTTVVGTPSTIDSFNVALNNIVDNVVFTASPNFQVSINRINSFNSTYTITLGPLYTIPSFKMYVRYNPASAGLHTGQVIVSTFGAPSTKTVNVSGISTSPLDIKTNSSLAESISYYPNPVENKLTVEFQLQEKTQLAFVITDVQGRLIRQTDLYEYLPGKNREIIETTDLTKGIYFLKIRSGKDEITKIIVKQ
jgi:hypothetical protein